MDSITLSYRLLCWKSNQVCEIRNLNFIPAHIPTSKNNSVGQRNEFISLHWLSHFLT